MPGPEAGNVLSETGTFAVLGIVAAGKGTITQCLIDSGYAAVSISDTTREVKDRDRMNPSNPDSYPTAYNFLDLEDIVGKMVLGEMAEAAPVHGNIYGTSLDALQKVAASGKRPMLEIDIQGVQKLQTVAPEMPSFFITLSNIPTWLSRWAGRDASITEDEFNKRVSSAHKECAAAVEMAYQNQLMLIPNQDAETAAQMIVAALEEGGIPDQNERFRSLQEFTTVMAAEHATGRLWEDFQRFQAA